MTKCQDGHAPHKVGPTVVCTRCGTELMRLVRGRDRLRLIQRIRTAR